MEQNTKEILDQIIACNTPLIQEEVLEERAYSKAILILSAVGLLVAHFCNFELSSALFAITTVSLLLLRRLNVLAIQNQVGINQISISTNANPAENTYQKIVGVINWTILAIFSLGILTFFIH